MIVQFGGGFFERENVFKELFGEGFELAVYFAGAFGEAFEDFEVGLFEGVVEELGVLMEVLGEFEDVSLVGANEFLNLGEHFKHLRHEF